MLTCWFLSQAAGLIGCLESGRAVQGGLWKLQGLKESISEEQTWKEPSPPLQKTQTKQLIVWLCHHLKEDAPV